MQATKDCQMNLRECQFIARNPQDGATKGMPLKHQKVNLTVNNAVGVIDIVQTYLNDCDHPVEVTLKFPIEKEYAVGKLTIQIGEDIIEGKILKKEKAQEKYEDAVAGGNTAVMAQEDEDDKDMVKLKLGNLLPG